MTADQGEEYIALLDDGERSSQEELEQPPSGFTAQVQPKSSLIQWTTTILALFFLVDLLAYLYLFRSILKDVSLLNSQPELEFRSPYRGLNDLYGSGEFNASRHEPIENVPRVAALVSSDEPQKVFPEDDHRWLSAYGTVTPLDRHLRVTSTIHTVLQFRVMDYGMERCALALRLPSSDSDDIKSANVDICTLDVARPLDQRTVSWATRPVCRTHVGTLSTSPGEEALLQEFPCRWGSLYTYEVSCASVSPECDVDVWADRNGTWGIFMYQYQTV